jgi:hypothetical protein
VNRKAAEWVIAQGGSVQIDGKDIKAVADLPKGPFTLAQVNLYGTPVTDAGLEHLKELKSLTGLNLKGTKVTPKGLDELHAAIPGCKIEHDGGVIEPKK